MADCCQNCDTPLKSGLLGHNTALSSDNLELVNFAHQKSLSAGCQKCCQQWLDAAPYKLREEAEKLRRSAEKALGCVPLTSIHAPQGWDCEARGLVTAQTVSGTGLFSDVTSAFTDLFGAQSGAYNQKIRNAEEMCRSSLRAQTVQMGGNAVVGVDVDYAEVGGTRAMLMVCMTGTAVNVGNPEYLGSAFNEKFAILTDASSRLTSITATAKRLNVSLT